MDLLLDVNIVLDICQPRPAYLHDALQAISKCRREGGRMWLYAGSVQTLEYNLVKGLIDTARQDNRTLPRPEAHRRTRRLLKTFARDKHWLAALADEGNVFDANDPEDEQLLRALDRFPPGSTRLLTRDRRLLDGYREKTISPEHYLQLDSDRRRIPFIDLMTQQGALRPQLERNIHRVLQHGQYILGPEVRELEEKLVAYTGAEHCIAVASGTEALLIGLMALDIGPGDEVITTPFTFIATAEVIVLLGARPVFVDIEADTCNIDARLIDAKITERTKAIMPVSLYGQPADMDEINAIAARHGIPVIEDAAQSFGAEYRGRKSGNLSAIGCTSFFPSKPLGGYGDGGAIFTNDPAIAQACREIRVHGQSERYVHTRVGVGGRMDSLQCAVVLAKLERFDDEVRRRIEIGHRYNELLDRAGIERVQQRPDRSSVFAQYTLFTDRREHLQDTLEQAGIPNAVHYPIPLNAQPAYRHLCCPECTPVAAAAAERVISLPMGAELREDQQERIVERVRLALGSGTAR